MRFWFRRVRIGFFLFRLLHFTCCCKHESATVKSSLNSKHFHRSINISGFVIFTLKICFQDFLHCGFVLCRCQFLLKGYLKIETKWSVGKSEGWRCSETSSHTTHNHLQFESMLMKIDFEWYSERCGVETVWLVTSRGHFFYLFNLRRFIVNRRKISRWNLIKLINQRLAAVINRAEGLRASDACDVLSAIKRSMTQASFVG